MPLRLAGTKGLGIFGMYFPYITYIYNTDFQQHVKFSKSIKQCLQIKDVPYIHAGSIPGDDHNGPCDVNVSGCAGLWDIA